MRCEIHIESNKLDPLHSDFNQTLLTIASSAVARAAHPKLIGDDTVYPVSPKQLTRPVLDVLLSAGCTVKNFNFYYLVDELDAPLPWGGTVTEEDAEGEAVERATTWRDWNTHPASLDVQSDGKYWVSSGADGLSYRTLTTLEGVGLVSEYRELQPEPEDFTV